MYGCEKGMNVEEVVCLRRSGMDVLEAKEEETQCGGKENVDVE